MFVGVTRAEDALTISYAKYRDFRGQLSPTVPSQFLMELPRHEMHVVSPDRAVVADYPVDWDEFDDDAMDVDPDTLDEHESDVVIDVTESVDPAMPMLTTAASLAGENPNTAKQPPPRPDPNVFVQGMRVKHNEYGLGKIVALSGAGDGRTATVNFVTAGGKKFILSRSALQPLM
jgi:DNA helicase-2/ATP-dependent DNA helicase PcrA